MSPRNSGNRRRKAKEPVQKYSAITLLHGALFLSFVWLWSGPTQAAEAQPVPGQILVKPSDRIPEGRLRALLSSHGAQQERVLSQIGVHVLRVPDERAATVLEALKRNPGIEFAELDLMLAPEMVPNDAYYSLAWHLPKIGAPAAWDVTVGAANIVVAILDSGVDGTHPDLAGRMVAGWNLIDNNNNTADVTGHGTGVAGQAVATSNNGIGVAAPAWTCKLMPIRVAATNGYASTSAIADGIVYAADHGVWVANVSFRVSGSATLSSAAQYLRSRGGIVVVSAGNDGVFDTSADDPNIITVSATDANDALASFSNRGNHIDLSAPGVNIVTTIRGGAYGYATGTSSSAPIVAGVAALMLSANPDLSPLQVEAILKQSADDLGAPGWDSSFGWGRINASNAVRMALSAVPADNTPPSATIISPITGAAVSNVVSVNINGSDDVGVTRIELLLNSGCVATNASVPAVFSWDTSRYTNGAYTLQARAYDAAGNSGTSAAIGVQVQNGVAPDRIAPTVAITSPLSGAVVSGTTTKVYVSASDNVAVGRVDFLVDGKFYATSSLTSPVFTWYTSKLVAGPHFLQVIAYDAAGNITRSGPVMVSR